MQRGHAAAAACRHETGEGREPASRHGVLAQPFVAMVAGEGLVGPLAGEQHGGQRFRGAAERVNAQGIGVRQRFIVMPGDALELVGGVLRMLDDLVMVGVIPGGDGTRRGQLSERRFRESHREARECCLARSRHGGGHEAGVDATTQLHADGNIAQFLQCDTLLQQCLHRRLRLRHRRLSGDGERNVPVLVRHHAAVGRDAQPVPRQQGVDVAKERLVVGE